MGTTRTGARSMLNLMAKACQLSRTPGFVLGVNTILGSDVAADFLALWNPLCAFVDTLIGLDNFYNQIDYSRETGGSEDRAVIV